MGEGESFTELWSRLAGITFMLGTVQQLFPRQLRYYLFGLLERMMGSYYPYVQITIHEYSGNKRNEVYSHVKTYLGNKSSNKAKCLKADMSKHNKSFVISLDEGEEITDEFNGGKLWWQAYKEHAPEPSSSRRSGPQEINYYTLTFHKRHRDAITGPYLNFVMEEAKTIEFKNRRRKLYTNSGGEEWYYWGKSRWSHIIFEHPATFDTLAMDPKKKREIIDDLVAFSKGKDYYAKIGKAWKRGYLLYGPPGTGKSTMIAAIANFMNYDVYDLELTSVKDNSELKKLLIDTTSKSIIVIEDIDCSVNLTGKRKKKKEEKNDAAEEEVEEDKEEESKEEEAKSVDQNSKLTLSGLLNFIDGIWSACGQERIIIFTTNHLDKLDPALIRRGRMDMHIEMSYCKFEAFKVLAKNYLDIDSHPLFGEIERMMEETNISPCDVAENLMPKTECEDAETRLKSLIQALKDIEKKEKKKGLRKAKSKKLSSKLKRRYGHCKESLGKLLSLT